MAAPFHVGESRSKSTHAFPPICTRDTRGNVSWTQCFSCVSRSLASDVPLRKKWRTSRCMMSLGTTLGLHSKKKRRPVPARRHNLQVRASCGAQLLRTAGWATLRCLDRENALTSAELLRFCCGHALACMVVRPSMLRCSSVRFRRMAWA